MLSSLLLALSAQAACPAWDAGLVARRQMGAASSALSYRWRPAPVCSDFSFDHYLVCWREDEVGTRPAAPTAPDESDVVCEARSDAAMRTQLIEYVNLSNHAFALRVFACGDADCTTWYGDDGASVTRSSTGITTAKERWVVTGVSSLSDPDRAVADNGASAATAITYPDSFLDAGAVGLWYSTMAGGVQNVRYMRSDSTAWGDWNQNGDGFSPATEVATSTVGGGFGYATHPWAVPAMDGPAPYVRLFLQVDDDNSPATGDNYTIWSVDSLDENGADFGLACTGSSCAVDGGSCAKGQLCDWDDRSGDGGAATQEVAASGSSTDSYLTSAAHGFIVFDYLADSDGAIDFSSETPSILFSGSAERCYAPPDEIFSGTWDGTTWAIPMTTDGRATCPDAAVEDAHDPAAITLPEGTTKVYMQLGTTEYQVCLYEGGAYTECEPIELAFDDGSILGAVDATLSGCTDNFGAFFSGHGGALHQGAFLHAMGSTECFGEGEGGILFADLKN